jgi:O-antigen/teichoic acid export membrane protein
MSPGAHVPRFLGLLREKLIGRPIAGHAGGNALWSALDAASGPIAGLMMAAGLVRTLGTREYGVIVVALAVSNLSAAIIPAISATTIKFVAEAVTEKENAKVARTMTASLLVVATIDILLLLLAGFFRTDLSDAIFGRHVAEFEPQLGLILLLAVGAVCLQQLDGVFSAVLKGLEHFKRQSFVEMSSRAIQVIASVGAAWLTKDVRVVLITYCSICAISVGVRFAVLRLTVGRVQLFSLPARADMYRLLRFGGWMWLNAAATVAFGTIDRIVVGRVSGPAVAAEYNIYMQLAQLIHFIPASVFAFSFPLFSRLGADKELNMPAIRSIYHRYFKLAAIIGISLGVVLLISKRMILSLFGGTIVYQQHNPTFAVLIVSFMTLSLMVIPYCLGLGLGNARSVSLVTSISMFASILVTISLTPVFGMEGAAFGRLIYGLGALVLVVQANRILRRK